MIASKWLGYEYKVKLLFSQLLFYMRSISSSKRPSVQKTDYATLSIINILARTEDDQVSIIVCVTYLYNLQSMWSQIKHAQFFLFVQKASVIFSPRKTHMVGNIQINTAIVTQSLGRTITKHNNEDFSHHQYFRQLNPPFKTFFITEVQGNLKFLLPA